jgi:hypothetical protein
VGQQGDDQHENVRRCLLPGTHRPPTGAEGLLTHRAAIAGFLPAVYLDVPVPSLSSCRAGLSGATYLGGVQSIPPRLSRDKDMRWTPPVLFNVQPLSRFCGHLPIRLTSKLSVNRP